ncbi:asparagine synthase-related protein [Candidatus Parabeggiatoa sp. HSG14]|uniref:asparagine synthase-related protein n=1 Tax=Candidatus Parabeggiatoa sp. HSG14 TaxID=3055593 RepID=UPI0025A8EE90|nr:asparagine synthase-related protein [Thiotrichales bacterium HSG14]
MCGITGFISQTGMSIETLNNILFKMSDTLAHRGPNDQVDSWLRGPLKEWAENLLAKKRLKEEGFLQANLIQKKWEEHLSGKRNWQYYLWNVLMFEAWLEQQ